ncbi:MarR family transcriptional regulator [Mycobacterium sp. IS-1496]|uniref:MarR family winged helix-turn-helix transcriptional regulator n=1 Tax=Mycobacterium sp. IS-1496 TaxID=1772284 RepID=UPI0009E9CD92|nr:MarR family transcriptional regulator [Mycobacterium sp. IS-1496]
MLQQVADRQTSIDQRADGGHRRAGTRGTFQVTATGRTPSDMPGLDIAELKSWQNYLDAALRLQAKLNHDLNEACRLTLEDVRLLHELAKSATGSVRMGALAQTLVSTPSRVSRRVDRLEARNLAHRASSDRDGRYVLATITDEGRSLLDKAMAVYGQTVRTHYLDPLSRPQTAAMAENCRRINAALSPDLRAAN